MACLFFSEKTAPVPESAPLPRNLPRWMIDLLGSGPVKRTEFIRVISKRLSEMQTELRGHLCGEVTGEDTLKAVNGFLRGSSIEHSDEKLHYIVCLWVLSSNCREIRFRLPEHAEQLVAGYYDASSRRKYSEDIIKSADDEARRIIQKHNLRLFVAIWYDHDVMRRAFNSGCRKLAQVGPAVSSRNFLCAVVSSFFAIPGLQKMKQARQIFLNTIRGEIVSVISTRYLLESRNIRLLLTSGVSIITCHDNRRLFNTMRLAVHYLEKEMMEVMRTVAGVTLLVPRPYEIIREYLRPPSPAICFNMKIPIGLSIPESGLRLKHAAARARAAATKKRLRCEEEETGTAESNKKVHS